MLKNASCYIYPSTTHCCEQRWTKTGESFACECCDATPKRYRLRMTIDGMKLVYSFSNKGKALNSIYEAQATANHIEAALKDGSYDREHYFYKKGFLKYTISELVENYADKQLSITETEKEFLDDYMVPFLGDVGVFVACKIHLCDFIRAFRLKGEKKEMAERLFEQVINLAA